MWTMRHMDVYVVVGPQAKVKELTEDMGHTMLLRDVQVSEPGKSPVKFLGWMHERTADGFRLMIKPKLIEDIVQDSRLATSTRKCVTSGVKDRGSRWRKRSTRTSEHKRVACCSFPYYDQIYNTLCDSSRGKFLEQLSRIASPWNASFDFCRTKLELFPKGRLVLSVVANASCAGLAERRSVTGGVVLLAGCCVASWSRTQASYALSSCESDLYATGSAAVEVLGVHVFLVGEVFLERTACRVERHFVGSAVGTHRQGTGRLKHEEVRLLAIRSWVSTGRVRLLKVLSAENVADVLTEHVSRKTWETLCAMLGLRASVWGSCLMSSSDMQFRCRRSTARVIDP